MSPAPQRIPRSLVAACLLAAASASPVLAQDTSGPAVVGRGEPLVIVPDLAQSTQVGSTFYWTRLVTRPQASFLKVHLVDVNLRQGDVLTLRSRSGEAVDVIERRGPKEMGTFWSLSAFGDELHIEFAFKGPYGTVPFRVDEVLMGFAGILGGGAGQKSVCTPEDFDDVICYQNDAGKWANVLASVGVMTVGGNPSNGLWCSGSNVSPSNYLLTNHHCISDQSGCNNAEFVFKYYRTQCNTGAPPTADWKSYRCNQMVAFSPYGSCDQGLNDLDFSLHSVLGDPAALFGFAEPDPVRLTDGEGIYIIQHPAGRPHEIAHGSGNDVDVDGTVLRYYDTLDTEGGSSGSPIYRESDDKLVGLHHCGGCSTPGIGNRGMLMADIYPHIQQYLCTQTLVLAPAAYQDLSEIHGNGDANLDPGETWQFYPVVQNSACSIAGQNVQATFQVGGGSEPITLLDTTATFGTAAAAGVTVAQAPIRFRVNPAATCLADVTIDLVQVTAGNGGPFAGQNAYFDRMLGGIGMATLFYADFANGLTGWTVFNGGTGSGPAATWTTANPGGRTLSLTSPFAIADSGTHGAGFTMNEQLTSPQVNASGASLLWVQFSHVFDWKSGGGSETAKVEVKSPITGITWQEIARYENGDASGVELIDVSSHAGQPWFQVRFTYVGAQGDEFWAVDDVFVLGDGGFVCGGDFFDSYQTGCAGSGGFLPALAGAGSATPGGFITLDVTNAQPNSPGFLLAGAGKNLAGCLAVLPPIQLFGLNMGPAGSNSLAGEVPLSVAPGTHFYLQWIGLDLGGPPRSYSNGLDVGVE